MLVVITCFTVTGFISSWSRRVLHMERALELEKLAYVCVQVSEHVGEGGNFMDGIHGIQHG